MKKMKKMKKKKSPPPQKRVWVVSYHHNQGINTYIYDKKILANKAVKDIENHEDFLGDASDEYVEVMDGDLNIPVGPFL
jgi:hypothetical protein